MYLIRLTLHCHLDVDVDKDGNSPTHNGRKGVLGCGKAFPISIILLLHSVTGGITVPKVELLSHHSSRIPEQEQV